MPSVADHYASLLGPIYVWMAGGAEAALRSGAAEIEGLNLPVARGDLVVDLGAGFGMHSIPLARAGARVTAIDTSAELLRSLADLAGGLPIQRVNDDLLAFQGHLAQEPSAILCMGDTITHLPAFSAVETLVERAAGTLRAGGVFVISLRDYSVPLVGDQRFIPVRSDDVRVLTCFLEYEAEAVRVHDVLHERGPQGWQTRVGHYRKLRLAPQRLLASLRSHGFSVRHEAGQRGMVRLVARRA